MATMNDTTSSTKSIPIPTHDLLLKLVGMPLYDKVALVGDDPNKQIKALRLYSGKYDAYCPGCGKVTTWATVVAPELEQLAKLESASAFAPITSTGHFSGGKTVPNWPR